MRKCVLKEEKEKEKKSDIHKKCRKKVKILFFSKENARNSRTRATVTLLVVAIQAIALTSIVGIGTRYSYKLDLTCAAACGMIKSVNA